MVGLVIKKYHALTYSGVFFGTVFMLGALLQFIILLFVRHYSLIFILTAPAYFSVILIGLALYTSARWSRLAIIQPLLLLAVFPIPIFQAYTSFYGLGLYICGAIMLYKGGFLEKRRVLKIAFLLFYLYAVEFVAAYRIDGKLANAFSPVLVVSAFLGFLYLMFKDRLIVYLRESKPVLSLAEAGLSAAEIIYVRQVSAGQSLKEIASDCGVSESTVRNSLSRAYKKFNVPDKTALVAYLSNFNVTD